MRTVLVMLIAIDLAILAVAYAPALEAVQWYVVHARTWWRRPVLLDRGPMTSTTPAT